MQYVRSISGSVSKTWNSINPATLSGAIDVIVIEQEDGTLACSPFHVRFGKFSLLRPYEKKVEFRVNGVKQDYAMKLGEGGEAFFVFETKDDVPESLQTSPLVSPTGSPKQEPGEPPSLQEPEFLDLDRSSTSLSKAEPKRAPGMPPHLSDSMRASSDLGLVTPPSASPETAASGRTRSTPFGEEAIQPTRRTMSEDVLGASSPIHDASVHEHVPRGALLQPTEDLEEGSPRSTRSQSPPPLSAKEAFSRAMALSKKLSTSNIPTHVTETGDLMLDMTGYKSSEEDALRAEIIARKILAEELEGNYDIGALIGADEKGNLWIYSSEEAKEARQAATRQTTMGPFHTSSGMSDDAVSDPGYHSDSDRSLTGPAPTTRHHRTQSDVQPGFPTPPHTPTQDVPTGEQGRNYAKTLRLTSDQLKALDLKPGANPISFSVNKATCPATMYLWNYRTPIVISDIDGTITKSDALGHVLNMIGRDWTHLGVAKLYTDIVNNGYNIMYLTSRSTGQADTTRTYLNGVCQEGYRLPKGPVIMSPDRTIAALRREIYLRKPEVFKMACLRDILSLFPGKRNPFYAGFGNRLTDALSYRSVNIPSSRIFTINSNAEVSLDLLSLNKYKSSYVTMRELVDHFFPPVTMLVQEGGEECTDFTYWREPPPELGDFSSTDTEDDEDELEEEEDEYEEEASDMEDEEQVEDGGESYVSRPSLDDSQLVGSVADEDVYDTDAEEESDDEDMAGDGGVTLTVSSKPTSEVNLPLR
ncbi:lipin Ned1 [Paecilomyces lecythidis]|uniref:Lipin Ned1 n=1 Tax=Paecilomyces lecythidis TaxID=3004212 RepID=A0ABR3WVC9_9EURO